MTELNTTTFAETIKSEQPVLVDFWAPWCGPCRILGPVLEELSDEMDGTAVFGKVNVDEFGELAQQFDIVSIPTLIVFKNGEPVERLIGVRPKKEIEEAIQKHV